MASQSGSIAELYIDAGDAIRSLLPPYNTLAMASQSGSMLARVIPATLIRPEPTIDGELALEALHLIPWRPEKENMPFCSADETEVLAHAAFRQLRHQQLAHLANAHPHGGHFPPTRHRGRIAHHGGDDSGAVDGGLE